MPDDRPQTTDPGSARTLPDSHDDRSLSRSRGAEGGGQTWPAPPSSCQPDTTEDTRSRDIDAALATAVSCRNEARIWQQLKFAPNYVRWLLDNARSAELWATKR